MPAVAAAPPPTIVLLSRPGCHLCNETREILTDALAERARAGLTVPQVREVSIESDEALLRRHLETIPVLLVGDEELPLAIDPGAIRAFLARTLDA